jgi:hypothetical protein
MKKLVLVCLTILTTTILMTSCGEKAATENATSNATENADSTASVKDTTVVADTLKK